MTQRERQASGGVVEAAPPPGTNHLEALHSATPTEGTIHRLPLWEDLYRSASPAQQFELLSLASRQGVLYAHQLPQAVNGTNNDRGRHLLAHLFNGQLDEWEPIRTSPLAIEDTDLDAVQREAVAKALHTPDLFVLQGLPGTGKSRVAAEIAIQAANRGERVLLVSPSTAGVDRVLEQIGTHAAVCALRCLGREEKSETLPPSLQVLTLAGHLQRFREGALANGRGNVHSAEQASARLNHDEAVWPRFRELASRHAQLAEQIQLLRQRRSQVSEEVDREAVAAERGAEPAGTFAATLGARMRTGQETIASLEAALTTVQGKIEEKKTRNQDLEGQLGGLRPLVEAKQHHRLWTVAWWRATVQGSVPTKMEELESQQQQIRSSLAEFEQQAQQLGQEKVQAWQATQTERARLIAVEVERRQTEFDDQEAALAQESRLLEEKWQAALRTLADRTPRPTAMTATALSAAQTGWRQQLRHQEGSLDFARQWLAFLEQSADTLPTRLLTYVNLVAAPLAAFAADANFGDASGKHFDLLILDEADQITEAEFLKVARRARRWVLIGEPARGETGSTKPSQNRTTTPTAHRPGFFQRLWQHLYSPGVWLQENNRLYCRLQPLSPEQEQWLESEYVADFPDVQLRILAPPQGRPKLAEVIFPAAMSIHQAKAFLFKELEELPVWALSSSPGWVEENDRLVLRLADRLPANTIPVVLEDGVRELVGADDEGKTAGHRLVCWQTCCVEFERGAGWDRPRAEEWVQKHLSVRDLGRTAQLRVPHRMHPRLAAFISDLVYQGAYQVKPASTVPPTGNSIADARAGHVEFIAVPPLENDSGPRRRGEGEGRKTDNHRKGQAAPPPRPGKGGAGLELDLSNARHREQLPAEVRSALPDRGLVNLHEARAVVRTLEFLLADRTLRASAEQGSMSNSRRPLISVIALYAAQAKLIRTLASQNTKITQASLAIEIETPTAFRQRESLVTLVSLTRSHTHRAVSYGESPEHLTLSLTRACTRLIVFGDAGTLTRRSQWQTALDHLDETAAAREREVILQLVAYLQGRGRQAQAFHLGQGSGA